MLVVMNAPMPPLMPGALAPACLLRPSVLPVKVIAPLVIVLKRLTYAARAIWTLSSPLRGSSAMMTSAVRRSRPGGRRTGTVVFIDHSTIANLVFFDRNDSGTSSRQLYERAEIGRLHDSLLSVNTAVVLQG